MLPFLSLGPWQVSTYVLAHAAAIGIAAPLTFYRLLRGGYPLRWIIEGVVLVVPVGLLAANGAYRLVQMAAGGVAAVAEGTTIFGALAGGGLAAYGFCRWRRISPGRVFDLAFLPLPLAQAIGRLGCFLAGCCYGRPAEGWLAMNLPGAGGVWRLRYPTQLIAAAADLLIFVALVGFEQARRRSGRGGEWPFAGFVAVLYGELFFAKRFLVEFLRDDPPVVHGPFTWAHLAALGGLVLATVLLALNLGRARRTAATRA